MSKRSRQPLLKVSLRNADPAREDTGGTVLSSPGVVGPQTRPVVARGSICDSQAHQLLEIHMAPKCRRKRRGFS